jgi:hypothetical protein
VVAVADDQTVALLVALVGERGDVGVDLGSQGFGQHSPGTFPHDLVDQRRLAGGGRLVVVLGCGVGGLR